MARRLLLCALAALAPPAARAGLEVFEAGAACRSSTDYTEWCLESADNQCRFNYDKILVTLEDCLMVCNTIPATCKGVEFLGTGASNRCEIWKVPILDTVPNPSFTCYRRTDSPTEDGMLYVLFDLRLPSLNLTAVAARPELASAVAEAVKQGIVSAYGRTSAPSLVSGVMASHIVAYVDEAAEVVKVGITPPAGQNALVMYAVLRPDGDYERRHGWFEDGTVPITSVLPGLVDQELTQLVDGENVVQDSAAGSVLVSESRALASAPLVAPAPTPAPTPAPLPGAGGGLPAQGNQRYTSGAARPDTTLLAAGAAAAAACAWT